MSEKDDGSPIGGVHGAFSCDELLAMDAHRDQIRHRLGHARSHRTASVIQLIVDRLRKGSSRRDERLSLVLQLHLAQLAPQLLL